MSASSSSKSNLNHNLQLRSVYKASKATQLRTTLDASLGKQTDSQTGNDISYFNSFPETAKDFNFRRLKQQESKTASRSLAINNNLFHRFHKEGRSLTASFDFRLSENAADATILTENEYKIAGQNSSVNSYSFNKVEHRNTAINLQYTEPLSQNSLVIASYGFSAITEQSDRSVTAEENGNAFFDSLQSRNFKNKNLEHRGGVFYQYQFNRFSAKAGGEVQQFSRVSERSSKEGSNIKQNGVNYFPSVNASYQFSKTASLLLTTAEQFKRQLLRGFSPLPIIRTV